MLAPNFWQILCNWDCSLDYCFAWLGPITGCRSARGNWSSVPAPNNMGPIVRGWRDHLLLVRLAAQNVGRRRLRTSFLVLAVMLGVGIGFASFVAGWALNNGIAISFSRMGADLVVV